MLGFLITLLHTVAVSDELWN